MINMEDQKKLASIYARHFETSHQIDASYETLSADLSVAIGIEKSMLEFEDDLIDMEACPLGSSGISGAEFISIAREVIKEHSASLHEFYEDFLPHRASIDDIAFYLAQETLQDPRFDDFIASLQLGLPTQPKLELAVNYWDEMGNGDGARMHTVMFQNVVEAIGITDSFIQERLTGDGLWCGNLSTLFVLRRHLVYRGIGYFATIEHMFPKRCLSLIAAWRRLGLPTHLLEYHQEHVRVDARHASGFFHRVIEPLIDREPRCAREIYRGILIRLNSSGRHLDALLHAVRQGVRPGQALRPA